MWKDTFVNFPTLKKVNVFVVVILGLASSHDKSQTLGHVNLHKNDSFLMAIHQIKSTFKTVLCHVSVSALFSRGSKSVEN